MVERREQSGERGVSDGLRPLPCERCVESDQNGQQGDGETERQKKDVASREQIHERLQGRRELDDRQHRERAEESVLDRVPRPALRREAPAGDGGRDGGDEDRPRRWFGGCEGPAEKQDAERGAGDGKRAQGRPFARCARPRRHRVTRT